MNHEPGLALYQNKGGLGYLYQLNLSKTRQTLSYGTEVKFTGRKSGGGTWAEIELPMGQKYWVEARGLSVSLAERNVLDIFPMGRKKSMWCWIAVVSMIDKHYHPNNYATQQYIADKLHKRPSDGGYVDDTRTEGKGSRTYATSGFSDRMYGVPTFEKIKQEIQGNRPIALLTSTRGRNGEAEHYIAIVGYYITDNGEKFVVINETREDTTPQKNGLQANIAYSKLLGSFSTGRGEKQKV